MSHTQYSVFATSIIFAYQKLVRNMRHPRRSTHFLVTTALYSLPLQTSLMSRYMGVFDFLFYKMSCLLQIVEKRRVKSQGKEILYDQRGFSFSCRLANSSFQTIQLGEKLKYGLCIDMGDKRDTLQSPPLINGMDEDWLIQLVTFN